MVDYGGAGLMQVKTIVTFQKDRFWEIKDRTRGRVRYHNCMALFNRFGYVRVGVNLAKSQLNSYWARK